MTTDETRDQSGNTLEKIVARAMSGGNRAYSTHDVQVVAVVAALRAAGLLVEGAPTDEQVERAAGTLYGLSDRKPFSYVHGEEIGWDHPESETWIQKDIWRERAEAILRSAEGVGPGRGSPVR